MPKPAKGPRLGGSAAHERLMIANLACALFEHRAITTTEHRAKRLQPEAERLISKAKRGDLHARRTVLSKIRRKDIVALLFEELAPKFEGRDGGYTRITKLPARKGDNAPMALIELVLEPVKPKKKAAPKKAEPAKAASAAAADAADVDRSDVDDFAVPTAEVDQTEESIEVEVPVDVAPEEVETEEAKAETDDFAVETAESDEAAPDADAEAAPAADAEAAEAKPLYAGAVRLEEGSADAPDADHAIKGNEDSMKYHVPGSQWYDATIAEVWFGTAEEAEAAGFEPAGGAEAQQVDEEK